MFQCDKCGKTSQAGEKCNKVVTETRPRTYSNGGVGSEIVREEKHCGKCHHEVVRAQLGHEGQTEN